MYVKWQQMELEAMSRNSAFKSMDEKNKLVISQWLKDVKVKPTGRR
jgi:hypothetical protein